MRQRAPEAHILNSGAETLSLGAFVIETGQLVAGHYRLVEHIGSGAMGVVWRAVDERLERSVAVKKVVGQQGLSEADRADLHRRAMREAKIAARLQHPNAIVVYDITEHEGDPCLVMEYLPSHSLSQLLAQHGTMSVAEACRVGEQMANALVAAHHAGIVHRDVKPGNILIEESGVAKLTDFGISRAQGDITLTQTGLVGGTPAYIAPELARGADPSPSSDVFALGATLYHAIEGQSVYGSNPNQLALLHTAASGKITPPRVASSATALLMAMLRPEPGERISMQQAAERLAAVASGGGVPAPPPPVMPNQPPMEPQGNGQNPPWQRTRTAIAPAADAGHQPAPQQPHHGTAAFTAVGNGMNGAPLADHQPAPPQQNGDGRNGNDRKRTFALVGGIVALLALVGISFALLSGDDEQPGTASPNTGGDQTTTTAPPSTTEPPEQTKTQANTGNEPIPWGQAGQLVIDFYTFPDGMSRSWDMLTPQAQAEFGSYEEFQDHWSEFDQVYAENAVAENNDDGSVTISTTVTELEGDDQDSERRQLRVVRSNNGLAIDSDPR
ncbi:MAG: protein kinase [Actinophytocola sp.]|nr:protein kinase [Actinophytocola sp.]